MEFTDVGMAKPWKLVRATKPFNWIECIDPLAASGFAEAVEARTSKDWGEPGPSM